MDTWQPIVQSVGDLLGEHIEYHHCFSAAAEGLFLHHLVFWGNTLGSRFWKLPYADIPPQLDQLISSKLGGLGDLAMRTPLKTTFGFSWRIAANHSKAYSPRSFFDLQAMYPSLSLMMPTGTCSPLTCSGYLRRKALPRIVLFQSYLQLASVHARTPAC